MTETAVAPHVQALEIPIDVWTQPFWDGAEAGELLLVRCADCGRHRWPPGPFCPQCRSQAVVWAPAPAGYIYSFTVVREAREDGPPVAIVPALIEFPEAGGVRLAAAIVDTALDDIRIGARVSVGWSRAANVSIPVFRVD